MECRINAEDPFTFVPSPGRIDGYHPPGGLAFAWIRTFTMATPCRRTDSMIAKLIAYGDAANRPWRACAWPCRKWPSAASRPTSRCTRELLVDSAFIQGGTSIHYLEARLAKLKKSEA